MNNFENELGRLITADTKWMRRAKSKIKKMEINGFERMVIQTYIDMNDEIGKVISELEAEAMQILCYGKL